MEYKIVIRQQDVDDFNQIYMAKYPRAKKPIIKNPQHPSLNEYMTMHNMRANSMKQCWKDFIIFVLSRHDLLDVGVEQCEIIYRTYFRTNQLRDLDNITPKYIFDGLVAGGFIVADDYRHIRRLITEAYVDKQNPRIELLVKLI